MSQTFMPYTEWAERYFADAYAVDADAMATEIIESLDAGVTLPEDFTELNTYATSGEPGAVAHVARILSRVADYYRHIGEPMPRTLDERTA